MGPLNRARLLLDVAERPAAMAMERVALFQVRYGVMLSVHQIRDGLRIEGITRKKLVLYAAVKDSPENVAKQRSFLAFRALVHMSRVVVVDESGIERATVYRRNGYAAAGVRPMTAAPTAGPNARERYNFINAMTIDGMLPCTMGYLGSTNSFVYEWWVVNSLLRCVPPGSVVVADNASFHRLRVLAPIFAAAGVVMLQLPAYSPEYSPIEMGFGWIKQRLWEDAARTRHDMIAAWHRASAALPARVATGFFRHCGWR